MKQNNSTELLAFPKLKIYWKVDPQTRQTLNRILYKAINDKFLQHVSIKLGAAALGMGPVGFWRAPITDKVHTCVKPVSGGGPTPGIFWPNNTNRWHCFSNSQRIFFVCRLLNHINLLINDISRSIKGRWMVQSINLRPAGRKLPSLGVIG